jgi:REP element-mobilizing transposase RayT
MPSRCVAADLNAGTYYLTLTIQRWYYLFARHNRWQILAESLRYCQENKELELNGYVFMLNHIHLSASSLDMAGFLRDFKRFTSAQFKSNFETTTLGLVVGKSLFAFNREVAMRMADEGNLKTIRTRYISRLIETSVISGGLP